MKKRTLLVLNILLITLLMACSKNEKTVTIYTSMEDFRIEDMRNELEDQFPDINISIQYFSTGNLAAKLKAEGKNSEADIIIGLETSHVDMLKDNFESLSDYDFSKYVSELSVESKDYFVWERYSGAIIVNTDKLKEEGLSEPSNYQDLLKPEYKNLIMMPNPKTSGTGYQFLLSLINSFGEVAAFEYFDDFSKNVLQFSTSGSGPVNSLVRGEIAIGLGMTFQAVLEKNNGAPLKILYFEEGAPYNTTSSAVLKGKLDNENVKKVFDFMYNDYILRDKELFVPEKIFIDQPQITIPNYPKINYADMNGIDDGILKSKLIEKWKY